MAYSLFALSYNKPDIWASLIAQLVKNWPAVQETHFDSWVRKIHWKKDRVPTPVFLGFPCGSAGKESACNAGDLGSIPGLGRFCWRRDWLHTPVFLGFPVAQLVKNLPAIWETWVRSLGWEDSAGEGKGHPLQYSGLENSMNCVVWH